jgi:hypothetical protein
MIRINHELKASDLKNKLTKFWELSAKKIKLINLNRNFPISKIGNK